MSWNYYDIGVNLFCRQFPNPELTVERAAAAGVGCILTGTDPEENRSIDRFVRSRRVWGTAGIHPHNADRAKREDFEEIRRLLEENPRLVAVGECGLDFNRMFSSKENQMRCLEAQIQLAEQLELPLFLHEREAAQELVKLLCRHPRLCRRSVVHCFTGDQKTLEQYLNMGLFIGITGWICDDRRAGPLREAVRILPADRVLLETDAPYLVPRNVAGLGRINVPENIKYVARTLAGYMEIDGQTLMEAARKNTERLFKRIPGAEGGEPAAGRPAGGDSALEPVKGRNGEER